MAVLLGLAAVGLGLLHTALTLDAAIQLILDTSGGVGPMASIPRSTWVTAMVFSSAFGLAVMSLVFAGLWFRKNWVRWLYIALVVFSVLGFLWTAFASAGFGPLSTALRSIQAALWVVSGLSLMRPASAAWFKSTSQAPGQ